MSEIKESLELRVSASYSILVIVLCLILLTFLCPISIGLINEFNIEQLHLIIVSLIAIIYIAILVTKNFYYLVSGKTLVKIDRKGMVDFRKFRLFANQFKSVEWKDVHFITSMYNYNSYARLMSISMKDGSKKLVNLSGLDMDSCRIFELIDAFYFKHRYNNMPMKALKRRGIIP